ncbi:MAG: alpha/beta hydrolase [Burkholderiales bacterium PBB5]|nr:MAG: alpha/beta hydrolase [Burkholderiales bacterium PBB5]
MLRGLTREQAHWGDFVPRLQRAQPHSAVLCLDLPGAGLLHCQPCPLQVAAMLPAVRAQLPPLLAAAQAKRPPPTAAAGVAGPVRLLGLSMGGMLASAWAQAFPQEVAALVLVNTSLRPYSGVADRLRLANHADVLAQWQAIRQARPVSTANALRQLLAAARFQHRGPPPAVPTWVLHSAGDALVSPRCSVALAAAWAVPRLCHPSAGHDLPLDAPDWLVQQLVAVAEAPLVGGLGRC